MRTVGVLAAAAMTAGASAQIISTPGITANLDLMWQEDPVFPHNDNGVMEPGEAALLLMTLSFTGQNTLVEFAPPIGAFSSGTIQAFASAYLDIRSDSIDPTGIYNGGITNPSSSSVGPNSNSTGTAGYGVRGLFRLGGNIANGHPVNNGFVNIGPGQLPTQIPLTLNPIVNMERLGWAPASYTLRTQTFTVVGAAGTSNNVVGLYLDLDGGTIGGSAYLPTSRVTFGSVDIPIVPAPSAVIMMLAGCGLAARRRRREASR